MAASPDDETNRAAGEAGRGVCRGFRARGASPEGGGRPPLGRRLRTGRTGLGSGRRLWAALAGGSRPLRPRQSDRRGICPLNAEAATVATVVTAAGAVRGRSGGGAPEVVSCLGGLGRGPLAELVPEATAAQVGAGATVTPPGVRTLPRRPRQWGGIARTTTPIQPRPAPARVPWHGNWLRPFRLRSQQIRRLGFVRRG